MNAVPFYLERTSHGTSSVTLESALYEHRIIFLDRQVDSESINDTIKQILVLCSINKDEPITLVLNTPGGSINDGLALVDVIQSCPCPVRAISLGIAASMGAIILASCSKGYRYVTEHSRVMLHEPLIQNNVGGSCSSVQATAEALLERKKLLNKLLCKYTGKPARVISKATSFDNYLDATAAVELGVCDEVLANEKLYEILKGA